MADDATADVEIATTALLGLLQRHLPGRVVALHLVGSAADGDYQPGRSDLDFVAVLAEPASEAELDGLSIVHRLYRGDPTLPMLDGIWVTAAELKAGPDACPDGPTSHDNGFTGVSRGNRNPVTWTMLRENTRTVLGTLERDRLWHDPQRLASWVRENVDTYWTNWLAEASSPLALGMLGRRLPSWGVLGISRMHATLDTGSIVSKSAAGEYARHTFNRSWHRIIEDCLKARRGGWGSLYANPLSRRRDALAFVAMVIAEIRSGQLASE